jgi:hypothetical protein
MAPGNDMRVDLIRYSPTGCERTTIEPSAEVIGATLLRIAGDWSSTLYMESDDADEELMITTSRTACAVLLRIGESFYDLLGDSLEEGVTEFIHGGQPAQHPRRHLVSSGLAVESARCFLDEPSTILGAAGFAWEEQGEKESHAVMPVKQ